MNENSGNRKPSNYVRKTNVARRRQFSFLTLTVKI